jgi:hypothetical protein
MIIEIEDIELINAKENKQSLPQIRYNYSLSPENKDLNSAIAALSNIDNYGIYIANMINQYSLNSVIENHFGPVSPAKKKQLEKFRGELFPIKTKKSIDDLIRSIKLTPNLLYYEIKNDEIIFDSEKNPSKQLTERIIKTIMNNAGIEYSLKRVEKI